MYRPVRAPYTSSQRCASWGACCLILCSAWCLLGKAGPSPSPVIVISDTSDDSDSSDMPWAPLEPEPPAEPKIIEADEVTDMPVHEQGPPPHMPEPARPQDRPPQRSRKHTPRTQARRRHPRQPSQDYTNNVP